MPRNIDLGALRTFLTVAEIGVLTHAAAQLNLTQSAVSLQIKRLEESFGQPLMRRGPRGVTLTSQGEQLLCYAKRLIALNDDAWAQMTAPQTKGEIQFGAPEDLLLPHAPRAMQAFAAMYPDASVRLHSTLTSELKARLEEGALDLVLATEPELGPGGETLAREPLVWMGAVGGSAWRRRPLPLGTVDRCMFTKPAIEALDAAGVDWRLELDAGTVQAVEACMVADMVVHLQMRSTIAPPFEIIEHGGQLPQLPHFLVNLYVGKGPRRRLAERFADVIRDAYAGPAVAAAE